MMDFTRRRYKYLTKIRHFAHVHNANSHALRSSPWEFCLRVGIADGLARYGLEDGWVPGVRQSGGVQQAEAEPRVDPEPSAVDHSPVHTM